MQVVSSCELRSPPARPARPAEPAPPGSARARCADADHPRRPGVLFLIFTTLYTEFLWSRSMGRSVYTTMLTTRLGLLLGFGLSWPRPSGDDVLAYRTRPSWA